MFYVNHLRVSCNIDLHNHNARIEQSKLFV